MQIILRGKIPPKKNNKRWVFRGGRKFLIPSKGHEVWHKDATIQLQQQKPQPITGPVSIDYIYYMPDNRKRDESNMQESINDLLVDMGIIEDDCWQILARKTVVVVGVDKHDPRTILKISPA
jgi:Holliday junction resolvase RusA-like endonuclease